mmetsp:Transcript_40663/g.115125  ORF Transcript_40663/g.115125 Transcript_40663/m.115125 type:complete len:200 (+) Transcript_40663:1062-1661(+)
MQVRDSALRVELVVLDLRPGRQEVVGLLQLVLVPLLLALLLLRPLQHARLVDDAVSRQPVLGRLRIGPRLPEAPQAAAGCVIHRDYSLLLLGRLLHALLILLLILLLRLFLRPVRDLPREIPGDLLGGVAGGLEPLLQRVITAPKDGVLVIHAGHLSRGGPASSQLLYARRDPQPTGTCEEPSGGVLRPPPTPCAPSWA